MTGRNGDVNLQLGWHPFGHLFFAPLSPVTPTRGCGPTQKTGTMAIPPDRSSRSFEPAACLSEQPMSVSARRSPPAPAALEYYVNRLPGKCRARRLFQPPGCRASVPCDRPGDRRRGTCRRLEEKTPRSCSSTRGSPSQPFPPSFGPKSEKRSAPGSFRYRAVPRASTILHPRPFRKHPPELASRSRRFGSGGSSSLPNQSQSTQPDFQTLRKIFKMGSSGLPDALDSSDLPDSQKETLIPKWLRFSSSSIRQPWSSRRSTRSATRIRSPRPVPVSDDEVPPRFSKPA